MALHMPACFVVCCDFVAAVLRLDRVRTRSEGMVTAAEDAMSKHVQTGDNDYQSMHDAIWPSAGIAVNSLHCVAASLPRCSTGHLLYLPRRNTRNRSVGDSQMAKSRTFRLPAS